MSKDNSTENGAAITGDAEKRIEIFVTPERANEILAGFDVQMPDAADLDEIRLIIRDSEVVVGNWQQVPSS